MANSTNKNLSPRKRGVSPSRLAPKQLLFVEEFLADREMNAASAAKRAGFKGINAGQQLLSNPLIQASIGKRLREIIDGTKLEREAVLAQLTTALYLNPRDVVDDNWITKKPSEIPEAVLRCVTDVQSETTYDNDTGAALTRVKLKFMSKDRMLEMAMKHLGLIVCDPKLADQYNVNLNLDRTTSENFLANLLQQVEETRSRNVIDARTIEGRLNGEIRTAPKQLRDGNTGEPKDAP